MSYCFEINLSCFLGFFFYYLYQQFIDLENSLLHGDESEVGFV